MTVQVGQDLPAFLLEDLEGRHRTFPAGRRALVCFVKGFWPEHAPGVIELCGGYAGAWVIGLVVIVSPGGLGVREGAIYALLAGPLGPAAAFVVMIGSRLLMTATEVLAALVTLPLTGPRVHGTQA